jgi:hypothetical protein
VAFVLEACLGIDSGNGFCAHTRTDADQFTDERTSFRAGDRTRTGDVQLGKLSENNGVVA